MVRAAVSGALDYSEADPTSKHWRIRQKLILQEIQRREDLHHIEAVQRQWLAYVAHGGLTEESFKSVKESAGNLLEDLRMTIFPWAERRKTDPKKATMGDDVQDLIARYKEAQKQWAAEAEAKKAAIAEEAKAVAEELSK